MLLHMRQYFIYVDPIILKTLLNKCAARTVVYAHGRRQLHRVSLGHGS